MPAGLPVPTSEEAAHSRRLTEHIRDVIEDSSGRIAFSRFMDLALYSPVGGYYVSALRKFGDRGDFVTAPELGPVFAACLGRQVAQILDSLGGGDVLEIGAGSGVLAAQLLDQLRREDRLPARYQVLEISAVLQDRQRALLAQRVPDCLERVDWLSELPDDFDGVVLANEVIDAIPVDRFRISNGQLCGLGVAWSHGRFVDAEYAADEPQWAAIRRLGLAEGYTSEAGFQAEAWMRSVCECLRKGCIFVVDYGFPASELYHPQRTGGTLMCHYRHRAHTDPYTLVGLQDITAHVNFTALAQCARAAGRSVLGFTTQASFLLSCGIADIAGEAARAGAIGAIDTNRQIKTLTLPSEMGELFKVMAVGTGLPSPLLGFAHADHRGRL